MTVANQLTILRMAVAPIFVMLVVYESFGYALGLFVLAGTTDLLDGLIARKLRQKTPLGTFLDPIADKLLLISALIVLSLGELELTMRLPLWLTITVISRDVFLLLGVLIINLTLGRHVFPPSLIGKATTVCQLLTVLSVLIANYLRTEWVLVTPVLYLTLALTLISGLHYFARGMTLFEYNQSQ